MLSERTKDYIMVSCIVVFIIIVLSILITLPIIDMRLREQAYKEAPYKNQEMIKVKVNGDKGLILSTEVDANYNRDYIIRTKNLDIISVEEYEIERL